MMGECCVLGDFLVSFTRRAAAERVGNVLYILTSLYKRVKLNKNKTSNYTYSDQFYCSLRTLK